MSNEIVEPPEFLLELIGNGIPTIKESLLIEYLKILKFDYHQFNVRWVTEVAKSLHGPVKVVSDKNENDVLFIVPPLVKFNTTTDKLGVRLTSIMQTIMNSPSLAHPLLHNVFSDGIDINNEQTIDNSNAWKEILLKYGFEDLLLDEEINTEPVSNFANIFTDD